MHPVFIQTLCYGIVLVLGLGCIGLLQRGFFWKYVRVRGSFGRLIMVKIRAINRDYFAVGRIDEGFLVYKHNKKEEKRISITKKAYSLYKSISVTWIDVDEETNEICSVDYSAKNGFDAIKYNNLYQRALTVPQIQEQEEITKKLKIIMLLLIGATVAAAAAAYLSYSNFAALKALPQTLNTIISKLSQIALAGTGTVTPTPGVI